MGNTEKKNTFYAAYTDGQPVFLIASQEPPTADERIRLGAFEKHFRKIELPDPGTENQLDFLLGELSDVIRIDVRKFQMNGETNASHLFSDDYYLEEIIGLSTLDFRGIKEIRGMLGHTNLRQATLPICEPIDVGNILDSNICLRYADLTGIKTTPDTRLARAFAGCHNLKELIIPRFAVPDKLTNYIHIFSRCTDDLKITTNKEFQDFCIAEADYIDLPEPLRNPESPQWEIVDPNMKYRILTDPDNMIEYEGKTLFRIQALRDFGDVKAGQLGGYIEDYHNLSQDGNCWIYDEAKVLGQGRVEKDAKMYDYSELHGGKLTDRAEMHDSVYATNSVEIGGNARAEGMVYIYGSKIGGNVQLDDTVIVRNSDLSGDVIMKDGVNADNVTLTTGFFDGLETNLYGERKEQTTGLKV